MDKELYHHGIKGMKWGVRRYQNPDGTLTEEGKKRKRQSESINPTDISEHNFNKLEKIYKSMPISDRKLIDPDISSKSDGFFSDEKEYKKSTAFNFISDDGFILASKIPLKQNVDDTKGVEVAVGVINKGKGVGTNLTKKLVNWFNNQNDYDTIWWPVDEHNKASIRIAEKNGFIKDPLGNNYIYATDSALEKLSISKTELMHHGIKGMKWGVRRYQNPDGTLTEEGKKHYATKNLKNATIKNLHMWGKDPNHNVLYITGPSGTGKSTTALGLANTKDSIIHLDVLFDEKEHAKHGNNHFDDFCKNQGIDIDKARDLSLDKKDRWKIINDISDQIEPYGKKCFSEGTKVIVEGVQLADKTMFPDKTYFKDKPFISLNTSKLKSAMRAATRDNDTIKNKIKEFLSEERSDWYDYVQNNIKNMELMHHGIKGQKWGVKNGPPYPLDAIANGNAVLLKDYNGPAYFISEKKLDGQVLTPRVPDNFLTKNGYEDSETMRVSFAPSIEKCLAGLSQNLDDKEFYVYEPHDISQCKVYKPNEKAVPDSKITDELWIVEPVELKQVKRIKITGNTGSDGKSYKYGNQEAILFDDWTYEDIDTD